MYVDLPRYKKHLYILKNSIQKAGSHPYVNRLEGFMIQCFVLPCKLSADRKSQKNTYPAVFPLPVTKSSNNTAIIFCFICNNRTVILLYKLFKFHADKSTES